MKHLERVRDMLCDELDEIAEKGELTAGSLDVIDKLTHSIKSIDTILAMHDAGYSNGYMPRYGVYYEPRTGVSYGRKRDSMGRYSRDGHVDALIGDMREMLPDLPAEKQREVQRIIGEMERL